MIRESQSHRRGPVAQAMMKRLSTIWIRAWSRLAMLLPLLPRCAQLAASQDQDGRDGQQYCSQQHQRQ